MITPKRGSAGWTAFASIARSESVILRRHRQYRRKHAKHRIRPQACRQRRTVVEKSMTVGELKKIIADLPDDMTVYGGNGQEEYQPWCHAFVFTKGDYENDYGEPPPEGWADRLIVNTDWR